mmetsp:Transcript_68216/g.221984  ORF Transcript_68216/g.221984 Transcript_68216/m.221984 type:complete len:83 (-) Transcript_68216:161-409(-)
MPPKKMKPLQHELRVAPGRIPQQSLPPLLMLIRSRREQPQLQVFPLLAVMPMGTIPKCSQVAQSHKSQSAQQMLDMPNLLKS